MATFNFADPYVMEDSDQEGANDSEDEISQWLDGTPQQKKAIRRRSIGLPSDSSEDEFEKEMMTNLNSAMTQKFPMSEQACKSKLQQEEENNDALFYDPKMDDEDEAWVKKQRASYKPTPNLSTGNSTKKGAKTKDATSDAVLNCPACMCAVCLDCQRHDVYQDQFRAMFTLNTVVNYGETLQFKKKASKSSKKNKRKRKHNDEPTEAVSTQLSDYSDMITLDSESASQAEESDCYHPVMCSNCNTRLAVYDSDEVYHFFNVISSYS